MYALWWIVKADADKLELSDEDIERIKRKLKKKLEENKTKSIFYVSIYKSTLEDER